LPDLAIDHHVGDSWDTSHNISHMVVDVPDTQHVINSAKQFVSNTIEAGK
jgi:hypothetical protein